MALGTLWQFKLQSTPTHFVYLLDHDRLNLMGFNGQELVLHEITQGQDLIESKLQEIHSFPAQRLTSFEQPFLLPTGFEAVSPFASSAKLASHSLGKERTLSFNIEPYANSSQGHALIHPFKPLWYYLTSNRTSASQLLIIPTEKHVSILLEQKGKLLIANRFPAENEAAVLYFSIAPLRKFDIDMENCSVKVFQNQDWMHVNKDNFSRYLPQAAPWKTQLPYPSDQYPPFDLESHLLMLTRQCALQEEA